MRKKSLSLVLLMSLMGTVVSLGAQELAQSAVSPLTVVGNDISIGGSHTLYATVVHYNNTPTLKTGGFQPLDDATTVTCPDGGGSCLIEFDQYLQIGDNTTNNRWAICSKLDGVFVSTPNCPYQGYTHLAGEYFYKVGSFVQFAGSVSPGTHTVRTFVNSDDGLAAATWSIIYRVYQP